MTEHFHETKKGAKSTLKKLMQRKNHPAWSKFIGMYLLFLGLGLVAVQSWGNSWWLLLFTLIGLGLVQCSLFACEHETVHGTAFQTKRWNQIAAFLAGIGHFYPPALFRDLHFTHHRHTHVPGLDPEISLGNQPGPSVINNLPLYLVWISGFPLYFFKIMMTIMGAFGMPEVIRTQLYPFVKPKHRKKIAIQSLVVLSVYAALFLVALYVHAGFWAIFIGQIIGHCFLAIYLTMEHNGLPHEGNILNRTRSINAPKWVKSLMWNMTYHAEHHAYPAVPYHALPQLHEEMKDELIHKNENHPTFHWKVLKDTINRTS